jgi:hypothetical protein
VIMSESGTALPLLVGHRFAVPMTGVHVRRVFDEWCLRR